MLKIVQICLLVLYCNINRNAGQLKTSAPNGILRSVTKKKTQRKMRNDTERMPVSFNINIFHLYIESTFWTFIETDNHATLLDIDFHVHFHGNETLSLFLTSFLWVIVVHWFTLSIVFVWHWEFRVQRKKDSHFDWHRKYYISVLLFHSAFVCLSARVFLFFFLSIPIK